VAEKFGRARKAGACGLAAFQPTVDKMYEHVRGEQAEGGKMKKKEQQETPRGGPK